MANLLKNTTPVLDDQLRVPTGTTGVYTYYGISPVITTVDTSSANNTNLNYTTSGVFLSTAEVLYLQTNSTPPEVSYMTTSVVNETASAGRTRLRGRTQFKTLTFGAKKLGDGQGGSLLNTDNITAPNIWNIGTGSVTLNVGTNSKITGLTSQPVDLADIASKGYADAIATGLDVKQSVKAATTGPIVISGSANLVIDGVTLSQGDRVLVKNQVNAAQNGIYTINVGSTWPRAYDADNSNASNITEVSGGMFMFVEGGNTYSGTGWVLTAPTNKATLGTDALVFTQFSGDGTYSASNGLQLISGVLSANLYVNSGLTLVGQSLKIGTDITLNTVGDNLSVNTGAVSGIGFTNNGLSIDFDGSLVAGTGLLSTGTGLEIDGTTLAGPGIAYSAGAVSFNAGAGLIVNGDQVDVVGDNSILVSANNIKLNINPNGGLELGANGIGTKLNISFGALGTIQPMAQNTAGLFFNVDPNTIVDNGTSVQNLLAVNVKAISGIDTTSGLSIVTDSSLNISGTNKLQVSPLSINQNHIDFGTGINQVSATDIPVGTWGGTASNILTALNEIDSRLDTIGGSTTYGILADLYNYSSTPSATFTGITGIQDIRIFINGQRILNTNFVVTESVGNTVITFSQNPGNEWDLESDDVVFIDYETPI